MKKDYVKQEHYIPQFALKNFQNKNNKIPFVYIKKKPLKLLCTSSTKLMQEKDFYEIKDLDGVYVLRNLIEEVYSSWESEISPKLRKFLTVTSNNNFRKNFIEIVNNKEWADIETSLLSYLVLILIRGKEVKNITYSNTKLSSNEQHILHLLMTTSQFQTIEFAKKLYSGQELENILYFIKNDTTQGILSNLTNHIMKKYQIRICKTVGEKKLFLSDNPVIIQKFEGEDYILPISPNICIILIPINIKDDVIKIDTHIYSLYDNHVDKINEQSVLNTDSLIIISEERDLEFIKNIKCSD